MSILRQQWGALMTSFVTAMQTLTAQQSGVANPPRVGISASPSPTPFPVLPMAPKKPKPPKASPLEVPPLKLPAKAMAGATKPQTVTLPPPGSAPTETTRFVGGGSRFLGTPGNGKRFLG